MVALAQWIESQDPDVEPEYRVWDFLGDPPNRVRRTLAQIADCDREMSLVDYESCRGVSLAQRAQAYTTREDAHAAAKGLLMDVKPENGVEWAVFVREQVVDGNVQFTVSAPMEGVVGSVGKELMLQAVRDESVVGISHLHNVAPDLSVDDFISAIFHGYDISSVKDGVGELYKFPRGAEGAGFARRRAYAREWFRAYKDDNRMWKNIIKSRFDNRPLSGRDVFFQEGNPRRF